jgi:hypothetical protein
MVEEIRHKVIIIALSLKRSGVGRRGSPCEKNAAGRVAGHVP